MNNLLVQEFFDLSFEFLKFDWGHSTRSLRDWCGFKLKVYSNSISMWQDARISKVFRKKIEIITHYGYCK